MSIYLLILFIKKKKLKITETLLSSCIYNLPQYLFRGEKNDGVLECIEKS